MAQSQVTTRIQLVGDNFAHAWYFNRFRCDEMGSSVLVTMALIPKLGGAPEVNGFVISKSDLASSKDRSMKYLSDLNAVRATEKSLEEEEYGLQSVSPSRVYPINVLNLARLEGVGEIGLYRYSIHTLLNASRSLKGSSKAEKSNADNTVPSYPVVMFRSELAVHQALIKDLFAS